jgi:hypothetical protein
LGKKSAKVAIFRVSVLGGSQNKVGSLKFLFFWLISSRIWLIRLVDDHQNKIVGEKPQIGGKKPWLGYTMWMIKFLMEKKGEGEERGAETATKPKELGCMFMAHPDQQVPLCVSQSAQVVRFHLCLPSNMGNTSLLLRLFSFLSDPG